MLADRLAERVALPSPLHALVETGADEAGGSGGHGVASLVEREHPYISKAALILDQVADTFYLKDAEGKKLKDAALIERIREQLLEAARGREAGRDG